jgi:hypothetical protein
VIQVAESRYGCRAQVQASIRQPDAAFLKTIVMTLPDPVIGLLRQSTWFAGYKGRQ